jgi:ribosomal protein S18 acetylase RimI-like enzyme
VITVLDKERIREHLSQDSDLHLYELGDLDDFFWPHTRWYGLEEDGGRLRSLALLYSGTSLPVLLALEKVSGDGDGMGSLLEELLPHLPPRLYSHLSPHLVERFSPRYALEPHGEHRKMALVDRARIKGIDTRNVIRLSSANLDEVRAFYESSYPGNWFDARMLETGQYFGLRIDGSLASIAGVHVYSPAYRVAALGNVATRPSHRGKRLARTVTARLCASLLETVDRIGLNVKSDDRAAIACYRGLGFEHTARYEENMLILRG